MLFKKRGEKKICLSAPLVGRIYGFSAERQGMVRNASMKSIYSV
jgi:hypothetical protein